MHLRPLLKSAVPHLDSSGSVTFIASQVWFGTQHQELALGQHFSVKDEDAQEDPLLAW